MVGFASGGRRRSEIAGLVEQLAAEDPVPDADGSDLISLSIGGKHAAPITTRSLISPVGRSMH
jgi:hypothetical protein